MISLEYILRMKSEPWRLRLREAVEASGKSMRAISLAAGAAPGYLFGVLEADKDPSIDKLLAVCDAIPASPLYILLGVDAMPEDVLILKALHENPAKRLGILALLAETKVG